MTGALTVDPLQRRYANQLVVQPFAACSVSPWKTLAGAEPMRPNLVPKLSGGHEQSPAEPGAVVARLAVLVDPLELVLFVGR